MSDNEEIKSRYICYECGNIDNPCIYPPDSNPPSCFPTALWIFEEE